MWGLITPASCAKVLQGPPWFLQGMVFHDTGSPTFCCCWLGMRTKNRDGTDVVYEPLDLQLLLNVGKFLLSKQQEKACLNETSSPVRVFH